MDAGHVADDLEAVILTEEQILARVAALADELYQEYGTRDPVLVGVLGGAATFTVDLARAYPGQLEVGWMALKSYSTRNRASGSVRLLKDLDVDIAGRNVIIGPGSRQLDSQLTRDVRLGGTRTVSIQFRATNLLNMVNYTAIDTWVNSPTFGQVLNVRPMRSAQLNLRFRF